MSSKTKVKEQKRSGDDVTARAGEDDVEGTGKRTASSSRRSPACIISAINLLASIEK